jgi:FAD/FMN-containing dehydrogenase
MTDERSVAEAIFALVDENRENRRQMHQDLGGAVKALTDSVHHIETTVQDLHTAIVGDEMGNTGVIRRQRRVEEKLHEEEEARCAGDDRLEEKIDDQSRRIDRLHWVAAGVGIGAGLGAGGIVSVVFRLIGS